MSYMLHYVTYRDVKVTVEAMFDSYEKVLAHVRSLGEGWVSFNMTVLQ